MQPRHIDVPGSQIGTESGHWADEVHIGGTLMSGMSSTLRRSAPPSTVGTNRSTVVGGGEDPGEQAVSASIARQ